MRTAEFVKLLRKYENGCPPKTTCKNCPLFLPDAYVGPDTDYRWDLCEAVDEMWGRAVDAASRINK